MNVMFFASFFSQGDNSHYNSNDSIKNKKKSCATIIPDELWNIAFNKNVDDYKTNLNNRTKVVNFVIPVVVHVINNGQQIGTYPNLSQAQVRADAGCVRARHAQLSRGQRR